MGIFLRAACATAAAMWAVSASAQSLDVERKGTIPDVRVERSGLISDGRLDLTMQVDYLYRASTLMGEPIVNCGLRVRDIRGSVSFHDRGRAVKVEIDASNENLVSVVSATFVMDFEGVALNSHAGLRCGEGVIARAETEPFNVANSPAWERAFCRYPSPAGRSMPEHFHFAGGWCQGLRGNFLNEEEAKANFREPSRHMAAKPTIRSMALGISELMLAWRKGEVEAEAVEGEEGEAARRVREVMASLQADWAAKRAEQEAERAIESGADLETAHRQALKQCEVPRPTPPQAIASMITPRPVSGGAAGRGSGGIVLPPAAHDTQSNEVVSLVLLIDVSGSMSGGRIEAAKRAAIETVGRAASTPNTEFAIFSFTGDCGSPDIRSTGFSRDAAVAERFIDNLVADGGTPLGPAVGQVNRYISQNRSPQSDEQMVILLADGDDGCNNVNSEISALSSAGILFRHETIGLEVSESAASTLQLIARESGGTYRGASSPAAVASTFQSVVDDMEVRERQRRAEQERLLRDYEHRVSTWENARNRCLAQANFDHEIRVSEVESKAAQAATAQAEMRAVLDRRRGLDGDRSQGNQR